jgi:hypothetical protein
MRSLNFLCFKTWQWPANRHCPKVDARALQAWHCAGGQLLASSSALQDGAQTACALPSTLRVPMSERALCLPHKKQDMVAPPNDAAAAKGEPETLDL